ncbi:MAG: ParA family protein [Desulfomonilaceae bacterium]
MEARIISFVNFKGGVGKTALAVNLATSLAHQLGERVLLVDLDPQSNASICVMGPDHWDARARGDPTHTIYGLLKNQHPIGPCIVKDAIKENGVAAVPKLHLLPSCYKLMDFEDSSVPGDGKAPYVIFWEQIMGCLGSYDFILIDCPPNLYRTTRCAIFSCHHILVPCNPDSLSAIGLSLLARKIREFQERSEDTHYRHRPGEPQPAISGILINNKPPTEQKANRYSETVLRSKLEDLKVQKLTAPDAEVFPVGIRHAADFRTGSFEYRPLLFAREVKNKDLLGDYRNLAIYIRDKFKGD